MTRIVYSPMLDCICFYGVDVHTGIPTSITFGDVTQTAKTILMYNPLLCKFMLSSDAGLTWKPVPPWPHGTFWNTVNLVIGQGDIGELL